MAEPLLGPADVAELAIRFNRVVADSFPKGGIPMLSVIAAAGALMTSYLAALPPDRRKVEAEAAIWGIRNLVDSPPKGPGLN
jgi:hypothetical protein